MTSVRRPPAAAATAAPAPPPAVTEGTPVTFAIDGQLVETWVKKTALISKLEADQASASDNQPGTAASRVSSLT